MKKVALFIGIGVVGISAFVISCNNTTEPPVTPPNPTEQMPLEPTNIPYQVVNVFPHDTASYIEGLQYVDGKFYESAGNYGESDIRITDPASGKVLQSKKLDKKYFGEGITVINGKVFQMTYQENTCFVYDAKTLELLKTFTYNFGQGWGMTTDGKYLIISTGDSNLYYYDPETFKEVKRVGVYNQFGPVSNINELEYIKGFVYANRYTTDFILKIDPSNGKVVGQVNLGDLRSKYDIPEPTNEEDHKPEVLNGIAYDSVTNRIFITGKNWPKLFEVKFDN